MWTIYSQAVLTTILVSIFLAVIVYRNNPERLLNRLFLLPAILFIIWNIGVLLDFFFPLTNYVYIRRCVQVSLPLVTLHFLLVFLRSHVPGDWFFLRLGYIFGACFIALFLQSHLTDLWVTLISMWFFLPIIAKGLYRLMQQLKRSVSRLERFQIFYLFLGCLIWLSGSLLELVPTRGLPSYPLSSLGGLAFLGMSAWTLVRLRLIDISILMGKLIMYIILITVLLLFYFIFSQSWPDTMFSHFLKLVLAVILIVIVYEPSIGKVVQWTNRIMLRESHDLLGKLKELNRALVTIIDQGQLQRRFLQTLAEAEKISMISLFMSEKDDGDFYLVVTPYFPAGKVTKIERDKPVIQYLGAHRSIVDRDEIERELQIVQSTARKKEVLATYRTMSLLDAEIFVPIFYQQTIRGLIALKSNESSYSFTREEKNLLLVLADQMGIIAENARLYSLMKQRDRLAAIGQMSTGLAHEIRNPLGALKATAQFLESSSVDATTKEYLQIIIDEVNRLNDVVTRFLDFAHPLKLTLASVNLNSLVMKTVNFLKNQPTWEKIVFDVQCATDLPEVRLDENQIKQVLMNLIINAEQSMPGGGHIVIVTGLIMRPHPRVFTEEKRKPRRMTRDPGHVKKVPGPTAAGEPEPATDSSIAMVEVSVTDRGCGIAPEYLDKIFTPFFTTKDSGSGLGLSIVHRIIESHGGTIDVHSRLGEGTRMSVRLPLFAKTES